jgi:hypothetical protein
MALILSGTDGLSDVDGSAATPAIRGTDTNTGMFFPAADTIAFSEGGVEVMRINSSGFVGIGTATPTQPLTVGGNGNILTAGGGTFYSSGLLYIRSGSGQNLEFGANDTNSLMILNTSGNLGLGVTPSAWGTGNSVKGFQLPGVSLWGFAATNAYLSANSFYNGTDRIYTNSSFATEYAQAGGQHIWYNAPSGTAGNAITFTQAMTLDASGNLGIGTTTIASGSKLTVAINTSGATVPTDNLVAIADTQDMALGDGGGIRFGGVFTTGGGYNADMAYIKAYKENATSGNYSYALTFGTRANGGNPAERMRIDSSGRLLVGLTSSGSGANASSKVQVSQSLSITGPDGELILNNTGGDPRTWRILSATSGGATAALRFYDDTAGAERMRIDVNGVLQVGGINTFNDSAIIAYANGRGWAGKFQRPDNGNLVEFLNNSSTAGSITVSGTSTSYVTSSDYRLKENIAPITGALAKVAQLKPVTYTWKAEQTYGEGFIAHELAEVCPLAVVNEKDQVDAEGNPVYQGIDTSFLVATLTAAIQEQQTLINDLTTRLTALENK